MERSEKIKTNEQKDISYFFFKGYGDHRDLHVRTHLCPTRRSSDLRMVAQMLERHGKTFIAVDADADTVRRARDEGYPIVFGDGARPGFVEKLDLGHAASLVLTMDNPVQNVATTARARENWPELCIVARARDSGHAGEQIGRAHV